MLLASSVTSVMGGRILKKRPELCWIAFRKLKTLWVTPWLQWSPNHTIQQRFQFYSKVCKVRGSMHPIPVCTLVPDLTNAFGWHYSGILSLEINKNEPSYSSQMGTVFFNLRFSLESLDKGDLSRMLDGRRGKLDLPCVLAPDMVTWQPEGLLSEHKLILATSVFRTNGKLCWKLTLIRALGSTKSTLVTFNPCPPESSWFLLLQLFNCCSTHCRICLQSENNSKILLTCCMQWFHCVKFICFVQKPETISRIASFLSFFQNDMTFLSYFASISTITLMHETLEQLLKPLCKVN